MQVCGGGVFLKIIDISADLFSAAVYPGDPAARLSWVQRMEDGADYNLSAFSLCSHNATHMDAPLHFLPGGADIGRVPLQKCIGPCTVCAAASFADAAWVEQNVPPGCKRLLIAFDAPRHFITESGARALCARGVELVGVNLLSVANGQATAPVHKILLDAGVVLLEGLVLFGVLPKDYWLCALPVRACGAEAAPCRAVLID